MDGHEVEVTPAQFRDGAGVARTHDVDDVTTVGRGEHGRDNARAKSGADDADSKRGRHSPTAPGPRSAGTVSRWRCARKKCPSGPMLNANATVPIPTFPPRTHPAASAASSSTVRTAHSWNPLAARPVIRPSRGPGPSPAPM